MIAAADSSTALMAVRASSAVLMPRSASAEAAAAASAAAAAASRARSTAEAASPAASPASNTSRACCSVTVATMFTAPAISSEERSESPTPGRPRRRWREISSAVDWIVSTSVATWPMPVRSTRGAVAGTARDRQVAPLQRRRQRGELRALGGLVHPRLGGGERLGRHRARQDHQHGALEDDERRVQDDHPQRQVIVRHDARRARRVLQQHEAQVVTAMPPAAIRMTRQSR